VARARKDLERGAGNPAPQIVGGDRDQRVVGAVQDQRRCAELVFVGAPNHFALCAGDIDSGA